jgi:predicted transposase YdaD
VLQSRGGVIMLNHDQLFKQLLGAFFAEFIELFLPEVSEYLDKTSLTFLDKELFTDINAGHTHEADLVVKAKFKNGDSFFIVHIETQAQHQRDFPIRLFRYFAKLYEKYSLPVYPIAVLSFDRPRHQQPSLHEVGFADLKVLRFRYRIIQLNQLDWRDYLGRSNPVAAALMAKMRIAPEDRPRVKLECLLLLTTLRLDPSRLKMISGFIDAYLQLTADEMDEYKRRRSNLDKPAQEAVVEYETSWHREGREEGRQEGMASVVVRLLNRRVGVIEHAVLEKVQSLQPEQLGNLSEALLDFTNTADLERWLREVPPHK